MWQIKAVITTGNVAIIWVSMTTGSEPKNDGFGHRRIGARTPRIHAPVQSARINIMDMEEERTLMADVAAMP